MYTIVQLSQLAGDLTRAMSHQRGLDANSPMLLGLASGFDVALTIIEQSTGVRFNGFRRESAEKVIAYFRAEADRSENLDSQIAIFYRCWADVIDTEFLSE